MQLRTCPEGAQKVNASPAMIGRECKIVIEEWIEWNEVRR